jgi:hypothetical protein
MTQAIAGESFSLPSGGNAAVFFTVDKANSLIEMASHSPDFVLFAKYLVRSIRENDKVAEANELYGWVRDNVRYENDPASTEMLLNPVTAIKLFKQGYPLSGDCDCSATLLSALMQAIGIKTRLKIVKLNPDSSHYRHVYTEAFLNGQWVAYDAAQAVAIPGYSISTPQQVGTPSSIGMSGIKEDIQNIWGGGQVPAWFKTIQDAINAVPGGEKKVSMATQALAWIKYPGTWIVVGGLLLMIFVAGRKSK